ncbi:7222_t:CDS:2 [Funneliformis mosseae]|uniref:7222_t:CDS:1 n=1 Tax=Funneliformis mosseae TaxID=27381 RepID=A0A9N9AQC3_FUNMO|nr:7222_t:CDS:2 [Funneliformis mosseae]
MKFSISQIQLNMLIGLVWIAVIFINIPHITAQKTETSPNNNSSDKCIPCNKIEIKCPTCPEGEKCILTLRSCSECQKAKCVKLSSNELQVNDNNNEDKNGNKTLLPAVIGGILGVGLLTAIGYGYFALKRRTRNDRGVKLDNNEEMISIDGENVIPIAYIPSTNPSTPTTPKPKPTFPRLRASHVSCGTSPLASPIPFNLNDESLIDVTEDDDLVSDVGTILQATKTAPTATLMTATRAKPALVRLNTVRLPNTDTSSAQTARHGNSIPNTPKSPMNDNTYLSAPSLSSVPSSPTSNFSRYDSETEQIMPCIDIERASAESTRDASQRSTSQHLNSRHSFGLFGSSEVYSNDSSPPQLQRESILSSTSSNGRSTLFSDDGDGEITIFWGGNEPPFVIATGEGGQIQVQEPKDHVDSTDKYQNEETITKETI